MITADSITDEQIKALEVTAVAEQDYVLDELCCSARLAKDPARRAKCRAEVADILNAEAAGETLRPLDPFSIHIRVRL